jgi:hypothetical protein
VQWLIDNGYLKSDALDSFQKNYKDAASKTNEYLGWSDNRIRGWLRQHGINVPMSTRREELLQTMRENCKRSNLLSKYTRWTQAKSLRLQMYRHRVTWSRFSSQCRIGSKGV